MDYSKTPVAELRKIALEKGIKDAESMKKKELAELLTNIDLMMNRKNAVETNAQSNNEESSTVESKTTVKKDEMSERKIVRRTTDRVDKASISTEQSIETDNQEAEMQETVEEKKQFVFDGQEYNPELNSGNTAHGILEIMVDGYGFLRSDNYLSGTKDIYISPSQIRRFGLRTGDMVKGPIRVKVQPNEKFNALLYIESVNGILPSVIARRPQFDSLTPIFPNERIRLDYDHAPNSLRIVDLFSPIGKGQRGMIVSPPKAGKTTLLKQIAKRISVAYPEMNLLVLLIDERPEEVTDIKESIEGKNVEVIYSTFDELPEHHKKVSEMVIERAKRLVESKQDVVILIDSITRLSRAYNLTVQGSGRTLSGGLDPTALYMPKKFFGAARNMREGGSLTILATALIDTGSRMDDVVFEEFKGTGNMELVLNRNLSEKRIFPAIDLAKSGTRKDDLLLDKDEQEVLSMLRAQLRGLKTDEMTEDIIKLISRTKNNVEFIEQARKIFQRQN